MCKQDVKDERPGVETCDSLVLSSRDPGRLPQGGGRLAEPRPQLYVRSSQQSAVARRGSPMVGTRGPLVPWDSSSVCMRGAGLGQGDGGPGSSHSCFEKDREGPGHHTASFC